MIAPSILLFVGLFLLTGLSRISSRKPCARIKDYLLEQKSLNTAMVLYELFSMEDRLVPSVEKDKISTDTD